MSSLTSRSAVLALARLLNYAVLLFSPLFLVRILDVEAYGMYREFVLYSLVAARIMISGVPPNILYFIHKDPEKESTYLVNTFLFTLITTTAGILVILGGQDWLATRTSFDFSVSMALYVFLFVNLDVVESYWLAKKRSDYVFIYSTTLPVLRMSTVIGSAYYTGDVRKIILAMIVLEGVKFSGLALWWLKRLNFRNLFHKDAAAQQLRFIIPLGLGVLLATLNQQFGGLFVANNFGVIALAIYTIGLYQIPIISIVRSAISDVIFPDMVDSNRNRPEQALSLWRRANNVFCLVVFPVFSVFWIYAHDFITLLFTDKYEAAVPIFRIMLVLMLLQCFEFGTPLRSRNQNRYFLRGNVMALFVNITITLLLYNRIGLLAPATAFLVSESVKSIYLAYTVTVVYECNLSRLFIWPNIFRIAIAAIAGIPLILIANQTGSLMANFLAIGGYCALYYFVIRYFQIDEAELVIRKISQALGRRV